MFASSVVVRNEKGEILLVQEADSRVRGKWNLPGGHAEDGESPLECAIRELHEETGLRVTPDGLLGIYRHADGGLNFVYVAHLASDEAPVTTGEDILSAQWLSIEEAVALPSAEVLRYNKLTAILGDLRKGREFPCDVVRSIPPEAWEE